MPQTIQSPINTLLLLVHELLPRPTIYALLHHPHCCCHSAQELPRFILTLSVLNVSLIVCPVMNLIMPSDSSSSHWMCWMLSTFLLSPSMFGSIFWLVPCILMTELLFGGTSKPNGNFTFPVSKRTFQMQRCHSTSCSTATYLNSTVTS